MRFSSGEHGVLSEELALRPLETPENAAYSPTVVSGIASPESGLCRYETIPGHSDGVTFRVAMRRGRHDKDQIAELAALADGSLDPERGAALREQVAASSGARRPSRGAGARGLVGTKRCDRGRGAAGFARRGSRPSDVPAECERREVSRWPAQPWPPCWSSRSGSPFCVPAVRASASRRPSGRRSWCPPRAARRL